jgi:hypothetical protein
MTDPDLFSKILRFVKHEEELVKAAEEVAEEDEELEDKRDPKEVVDDFSESVSYDYDASEEPYISFGVSGLLASTQKLLNVNKGIDSTDFRDALKFKKMFPVNKQISERIRNDRTGVRKKLLAAASYRKNLSFLTPFYFDSYGEKQLIGNQLSSPLEEINPIHLLENARSATQLGEGGIQSSDSITEDMQAVHPGQFGFLSGLEGPECFPPETEVFTSDGWVPFGQVTKDHKFCCLGSGFHRHFSNPYFITESEFKGDLIKFKDAKGGELSVTPNHRIYHTQKNDKFAHDVRIHLAKEIKNEKFYTLTELNLEEGIALSVLLIESAEEFPYEGKVYCANVPGGSVLVRTPQGSTWWTGNSERIGVDARLTKGVKIGSDGRLYQLFLNKRTGNYEYLNPEQVANRIVKLPD